MWDNYSDQDILALQQRIISSIPPDIMALDGKWMMRGNKEQNSTGKAVFIYLLHQCVDYKRGNRRHQKDAEPGKVAAAKQEHVHEMVTWTRLDSMIRPSLLVYFGSLLSTNNPFVTNYIDLPLWLFRRRRLPNELRETAYEL